MAVDLTWAEFSRRANAYLAQTGQEWAGVPIPIPRFDLAVAPGHPWRDRIIGMNRIVNPKPADEPANQDGGRIVNQWWSRRLRRVLMIAEMGGKRFAVPVTRHDYAERLTRWFDTMAVAKDAWHLDTELKAIDKLAELLADRPHLFETYVTTGTFIETSRRSGITYMFRRCRPTIALRATGDDTRILCALCLHPIAYYENTHAGGMCPTDDVIAHLLLMRADEPMLWRRANQHQPDRPEAAL